MPRPTTTLLAAATAAATVAVPAGHAEYVADGFSCGFASVNDPTGVLNQGHNEHQGELNCGPWLAAELTAAGQPTPARIDVCGWIQVNQAEYGEPSSPRAVVCGASTVDGAVVAVGLIAYYASTTDDVYLCTEIVMRAETTRVHRYDDDGDPSTPEYCALAVSAG